MVDRKKVISEFERWCNEMEDECPMICLHALAILKEQENASKRNPMIVCPHCGKRVK